MRSETSYDEEPFCHLRLDSLPGPALPLSDMATSVLIEEAIDRAFEPPIASSRRRWMPMAAAAVAAVFVGAAAAEALYHVWERRGRAGETPAPLAPSLISPEKQIPDEVPIPETPIPIPQRAPRASRRTPVDPLQLANQLRAEQRWSAAAQAYEHIVRTVPADADAAAVAAAALHLEHLRDPRGALALFRGVLRHGDAGPLAPEARYGVAQVYAALGRRQSEAKTLNEFLRRYPDSVLVPNVKARLRVLSGP